MDRNVFLFMILLCNIHVWNCGQSVSGNFYYNSRLLNYTFLSMRVIGIQRCISECVTRPLCQSVNFYQTLLECELNSMAKVNLTTPMEGYLLVDLSNERDQDKVFSQCSVGEQCVALSNNKKACVDDDTISTTKDCTDVRTYGESFRSGIYRIRVIGKGSFSVYCDMDTGGGGWLVFQRRLDGTTDFYNRNWNDYKTGFGNLSAEFWLGNDALHYILQQGQYELRMDMSDFDNTTRYVKYQSINVGDEASGYLMSISGYSGNVGDCFTSGDQMINNRKFTTIDVDNDLSSSSNCARVYKGGWWHNACHCANPNGLYFTGQNTNYGEGITYYHWKTHYYSLKTVTLMVRRKL